MEDAGIYARESSYLEHYIQIGIASSKILTVSFPRTPDADAAADHDLLTRIDRYLEGNRDTFTDVDIALTVPTNQRGVLMTLRQVPYGTQVSVERLTTMTPSLDPELDDDLELVRETLAANPTPLLIPDHRVRNGPSAAPPDVEQKLRSLEGL